MSLKQRRSKYKLIKKAMIKAVRFYQTNISGLSPPKCRYMPSCSAYAVTALEKHGAFLGLVLAVWRFLRCNPFSKGGIDNVPDRFSAAFFK